MRGLGEGRWLLSLFLMGLCFLGELPLGAADELSSPSLELGFDENALNGVATQGSWRVEEGLLIAEGKEAGYWLTPQQSAPAELTRFVFEARRAFEIGALVHASVDADGALQGYLVQLHRRRFRVMRIDEGELVELEGYDTLHKLKRRPIKLEIILLRLDKRLLLRLRDLRDDRTLATLVIEDDHYRDGSPGLWRASGQSVGGLRSLSQGSSCAYETADGPSLYATINTPEALTVMENTSAGFVVELTLLELTQLVCQGRHFESLRAERPLKYREKSIIEWAERPWEDTQEGMDLLNSYKDPKMILAILRELQRRHPERAQLVRLGSSHRERGIWAMRVAGPGPTPANERPALLLNGGHHGNEPLSIEYTLDALVQFLEREPSPLIEQILSEYTLWVIPVVNPDGLARHINESELIGRKNGRDNDGNGRLSNKEGVDLNRNYPFGWGSLNGKGSRSSATHAWYRGPSPGSEPETQAMMRFIKSEQPLASISYHTGNTCVLAPYTIDGVENPRTNEAWLLGERVAARMPPVPEDEAEAFELRKNIYPVTGTDQDWMRYEVGTIALLVEGVRYSPHDREDRQRNIEAVRKSWQALFEELDAMPSLSGRVLNSAGEPLEVMVEIAELPTQAGERWTTRCRDGRFDRVVPKAGHYTLILRDRLGGVLARQQVEVTDEGAWLRVILPLTASQCSDPLKQGKAALAPLPPTPLLVGGASAAVGSIWPAEPEVLEVPNDTPDQPEPGPTPPAANQGCACTLAQTSSPNWPLWLLSLMALGFLWRRMHARGRHRYPPHC